MSANGSVPKAALLQNQSRSEMLHALADSIQEAFTAPSVVPSRAQQIAEYVGVEYCGEQGTLGEPLHLFREFVTGTQVAVYDSQLSVKDLRARVADAHQRFGVAQS